MKHFFKKRFYLRERERGFMSVGRSRGRRRSRLPLSREPGTVLDSGTLASCPESMAHAYA